jgi:hypothetical protein
MSPYHNLEIIYTPLHLMFHDLFTAVLFGERLINDLEDALIAVIIHDGQHTKQLKPVIKKYNYNVFFFLQRNSPHTKKILTQP